MALVILASASFSTASAKDKKKNKAKAIQVEVKTPTDSLSYATGMALSNGVEQYLKQSFGLSDKYMNEVVRGFRDAITHRNDTLFSAYNAGFELLKIMEKNMLPNVKKDLSTSENPINENLLFEGFAAALTKDTTIYTVPQADAIFNAARTAIINKKNDALKSEGERFLAENKQKEGVVTMPSGLQYKVLKEGNGPKPSATDEVEVIYEGRTLDGNVFDATYKHKGTKTDKFKVGGLIKGWTEALQLMPVGSKWELYIPQELAYGGREAGSIKPYSMLIFTLELVSITGK